MVRDWGMPDDVTPATRKDPAGDDIVSPSYYQRPGGCLESFDAFAKTYGYDAAVAAARFNVHKYLYRFDRKHRDTVDQVGDLRKLAEYVNNLINLVSNRPAPH
jgi:hypothetical protein